MMPQHEHLSPTARPNIIRISMADDGVANGGVDDQYGDESGTKIARLQREREELLTEIMAASAADLETEVAKLQQDMISETTAAEEAEKARAAAEEARADVAELWKILQEKESSVEFLHKELEALKEVKAENEVRIRDLEREIGVLETKKIEERNIFEEEMRDKIDEKEKKISGLKQKFEELEKLDARKKLESEDSVKEELRLGKALRESEEKVTVLESSIFRLREEAKEAEKAVETVENIDRGVNENIDRGVNENIDRGVNDIHDKGKRLKLQWSTGAVVAAATVIYVCYGKRRR